MKIDSSELSYLERQKEQGRSGVKPLSSTPRTGKENNPDIGGNVKLNLNVSRYFDDQYGTKTPMQIAQKDQMFPEFFKSESYAS